MAFSHGCSFGRPEGLANGSTADKDSVVDEQVKNYSQVKKSGSKQEELPQPVEDQGFASTPMGDDEVE